MGLSWEGNKAPYLFNTHFLSTYDVTDLQLGAGVPVVTKTVWWSGACHLEVETESSHTCTQK